MSHILESVTYIKETLDEYYGVDAGAVEVTDMLVDLIHYCNNTRGVSFERCLQAARAQSQKEIKEAVDATPLPPK